MPSYRCRYPTCTELSPDFGYCVAHSHLQKNERKAQQKHYDSHARNKEHAAFYKSPVWRATRANKLHADPLCQRCNRTTAQHVHHVVPLNADWTRRLEMSNLMSLCQPCHNRIEAETRNARQTQ